MGNRINIYGTLYVDIECDHCGSPETLDVKFDQGDWLSNYDVDITLDANEVKDRLIHEGWKRINGNFVCPDCVDELKEERSEE